ncbi:MAG TPA: trigger factor [Bryobacteraceae bacterium]|nr:trigger factor [Bryobacteraceae bacterium]
MALIEGCKHQLEITIPVDALEKETERVAETLRAKVNLPGFRPGKAPLSMIRQRFATSIRQDAIDKLLPKFFHDRVHEEHLHVVGQPSIVELDDKAGEPVRFKAEFEVAPEVELQDYRGIPVPYREPVVTDQDVEERIEALRQRKADFVNLDPRPAAAPDVAVVDMHSVNGLEGEPMHAHDLQVELGSPNTLPVLNEQILGMSPGEEKNITIEYPENYGQERLAGKTVEFHLELKSLQKKELPEVNDEFAKDLGDFQTVEELRDALRKNMMREREMASQRAAKDVIARKLGEMHTFPVPEAFIDRQVEGTIERFVAEQASRGMDVKKLQIDPKRVKEAMRDSAIKEVRTTLVLEKISERESIYATKEELDAEVQRFAKQEREPVAAVRKRFEENGTTNRIANAIRTEKTLSFLFENARKEAPVDEPGTQAADPDQIEA